MVGKWLNEFIIKNYKYIYTRLVFIISTVILPIAFPKEGDAFIGFSADKLRAKG
jgi:hypothetical protein